MHQHHINAQLGLQAFLIELFSTRRNLTCQLTESLCQKSEKAGLC